MKKLLYILAFTLLGLLLATITHALVELFAIDFIFGNPERFASTFWWQEWVLLHGIVSIVLWFLGAVTGFALGVRWWKPYGSQRGLFGWRK